MSYSTPPLRITSVGTRVADASMLLISFLLCCGGVGTGTVSPPHSDFNVEQNLQEESEHRNFYR